MIPITRDDIVPTAERMRREGRALVMIHGFIQTDGVMHVSWDYAVENRVESYYILGETSFPSIEPIYSVAAEWPELELHELLGLEFEGLDTSQRLFLPEEMLDTQGKGQLYVLPMSELIERREKAAAEKAAAKAAAKAPDENAANPQDQEEQK